MQRARFKILLVLVSIAAGAVGFFAQRQMAAEATGRNAIVGERRPDFSLPDKDGKTVNASEFDGRVLIVNFWAPWCPPCRKEIPEFVKLQEHYQGNGVQFVGIAIDTPEAVADFLNDHPINYPILIGDDQGAITTRYGNETGALPYTVIVGRDGNVAETRRGLFPTDDLESALKSLL